MADLDDLLREAMREELKQVEVGRPLDIDAVAARARELRSLLSQDGKSAESSPARQIRTLRSHGDHKAELAQPESVALGIDIGHSVVRAAVMDSTGQLLAPYQVRRDIDIEDPDPALFEATSLALQTLESAGVSPEKLTGVGVSIPAAINRQTMMIASRWRLPRWREVRIDQVMRVRLEGSRRRRLRVRVGNDANLGALGEWVTGAARANRRPIFIKATYGIGLGLVIRGRIDDGATGAAGEFGHFPIFDPALPAPGGGEALVCSTCNRPGCLEAVASGWALLNSLRRFDPNLYGADLSLRKLVEIAREHKDSTCGLAIRDVGRHLGLALTGLVNLLDPDVMVIGGILSQSGDLLLQPIRDAVYEYAQRSDAEALPIVISEHGECATLQGALFLALGETTYRRLHALATRKASVARIGTVTSSEDRAYPQRQLPVRPARIPR